MNNDWLSLLCLIMSSPPVFSEVRVNRSLVLCVMFCRSLFVLLYFFIWPLCCLFFFGLRILITSLWYLQTFLDRRWMDYSNCLAGGIGLSFIALATFSFPIEHIVSRLRQSKYCNMSQTVDMFCCLLVTNLTAPFWLDRFRPYCRRPRLTKYAQVLV